MCGIAGKVCSAAGATPNEEMLRRMADAVRHRGPDDEGFLISGPAGFAFRRLSIIDVSGGHQPIPNTDSTAWTMLNGEIYNYRQLRGELISKGYTFRTKSDTEVIVHLYDEYGDDFVHHLIGMFGVAIWDSKRRRLLLARDRPGIKPLYYAETPEGLTFASEIKSLLADPAVPRDTDPQAVNRFLTFDYLPGHDTLFRAVKKLEPGHILIYENGIARTRRYWDLSFDPDTSQSGESAERDLAELLNEVTADHLIADVPVGLLLSGGVDSSALLAIASDQGADLSTFTIGFSNESFADERAFARLVADRYGTQHYETSMSEDQFLEAMPRYVWHMEEPVCEPPAIALYYVASLAADHVKVVLSGEGGDEAFAGYPNYRNNTWYERIKSVAGPSRSAVSSLLKGVPSQGPRIDKYLRSFDIGLDEYYFSRSATPYRYFNQNKASLFTSDFAASVSDEVSLAPLAPIWKAAAGHGTLNQMLYVDTKTWLPDDLLVKADKMTMAVSLELRVPLLDHRVLEFAARLPPNLKLRGLETKHLLKKSLEAQVPQEIRRRKKAGFPVPFERWLSGASLGPVRDLLLDGAALNRGYFQRREVERMLQRNADDGDLSKEIFSLAVMELWHQLFVDAAPLSRVSLT